MIGDIRDEMTEECENWQKQTKNEKTGKKLIKLDKTTNGDKDRLFDLKKKN